MSGNRISILADHVSKEYKLGLIGGGTLRADLQSLGARLLGKEDPNTIIGHKRIEKGRLLALKDVSFTIMQGERVGIIGHNGAGKSTLLKLISRVTAPTSGMICYNGRVASMLEVGTGFHPELTGRENIYMNGAILGMNCREIDEKLEDIIAFSEIGPFIDTPVKRYSSGMYLRLAFAVAAHLKADIVIIDEVLSVGDVEFQQKCIEKIRSIARAENRTVLCVSHNMATIRSLCNRCMVLQEGELVYDGTIPGAEAVYRSSTTVDGHSGDLAAKKRPYYVVSEAARLVRAEYRDRDGNLSITGVCEGEPLRIYLRWIYNETLENLHLRIEIKDGAERPVASSLFFDIGGGSPGEIREGTYSIDLSALQNGYYHSIYVLFRLDENGNNVDIDVIDGLPFSMSDPAKDRPLFWRSDHYGNIRL